MTGISFNEVPIDIQRPGLYMEIDPSLAFNGLPVFKQRTVMFGQLGTSPEASVHQIYQVITAASAKTLFGQDSILASMVDAFRKINPYQELLVIPVAENSQGVAATVEVTLSGAATRSYTQVFYVGDVRYTLGVSSGEAASSITGRLASLINTNPASYVTASTEAEVLTLTCKWKGETGNDINVFTRYYRDDYDSPGVSFAINQKADGAGNPTIQSALDVLDSLTQYQGFVCPYTDTANMDLLRSELDTRWGPISQRDGRVFCAKKAGVAALNSFALARNSQHFAIMDITENAASPSWDWAAALGASVQYYGTIDPARPFQTLELKDIKGAPEGLRRMPEENETLLRNGICTHSIGVDAKVRIERAVTTYSQNQTGAEDKAYKSLNTVMTMSYYRRSVINRFQLRYPRHKLASSGHPAAGFASNIITSETAVAEFLAHYTAMMDAGLMDDYDGYKADILANKNTQVRGRLDVFDQPRPMDQFHQLAVRSAFRLI